MSTIFFLMDVLSMTLWSYMVLLIALGCMPPDSPFIYGDMSLPSRRMRCI
jgi:hypothetical protein